MPITRDECPRLLSLAVHEFRSPVTVVAGYVRMLLKMPASGLGDRERKLLEEAEKSCGRLSTLLAELSDLANLDGGHTVLETHDLDLLPLLVEVAGSVHEGADRQIRLEPMLQCTRVIVRGDRGRLKYALGSLLEATLRERVDAGVVLASAGVVDDGAGPHAWIVVAPREADVTTRAFQPSDWGPFQQWRGGLGFRLVTAQELIAAHGGRLFSGEGANARGRCALILPVKEYSC